jgi:hypothetical protein
MSKIFGMSGAVTKKNAPMLQEVMIAMGTMRIIIDISEDSYKATCNGYMTPPDVENVVSGIKNGTPLPKGHGRLIDADAFQKYCFNKNFDKRLSAEGLAIINMFLEFQPTIIEADRE